MNHRLPDLPWPGDALAPQMSAKTLALHHGKHHAAYVEKLNRLVKGTEFEELSLEEIVLQADAGPIFDNAAQHWNHSFFWPGLRPAGGDGPAGDLRSAIASRFDSLPGLKKKFNELAAANFGSGWTWLVADRRGGLDIVNTGNAGTPLRDGKRPLLVCDVWEHAYYVDYENRRPDFLDAFWEIVDWDCVAARLAAAERKPGARASGALSAAGRPGRSTRA
jgi:Fe-Mn family superoxide dismutase